MLHFAHAVANAFPRCQPHGRQRIASQPVFLLKLLSCTKTPFSPHTCAKRFITLQVIVGRIACNKNSVWDMVPDSQCTKADWGLYDYDASSHTDLLC